MLQVYMRGRNQIQCQIKTKKSCILNISYNVLYRFIRQNQMSVDKLIAEL